MPKIRVVFFCEEDGTTPLLVWFERLSRKAQDKCRVRIERLAEQGHRMLYFFHGQKAVVLSLGISKQQARVPSREIHTAVNRKRRYQANPSKHTYVE